MEEHAFHPLDYLRSSAAASGGSSSRLVLRRRRRHRCSRCCWPKSTLSQAKIGVAAPTLSADCCAASARSTRKSGSAPISQQLLSHGPPARGARGEDRPDKPVDESRHGCAATSGRTFRFPSRSAADAQPKAASTASSRLHRQRARTGAAHRQPPRVRVRRGELEDADRPRREHVRGPQPAAAGQPGTR